MARAAKAIAATSSGGSPSASATVVTMTGMPAGRVRDTGPVAGARRAFIRDVPSEGFPVVKDCPRSSVAYASQGNR